MAENGYVVESIWVAASNRERKICKACFFEKQTGLCATSQLGILDPFIFVVQFSRMCGRYRRTTSEAELDAPWKAIKQPATQRLGSAVFESNRFSAIRYRSTKAHRSHCLAIFRERLLSSEHVNVNDPQGLILPD